MGVIVNVVTLGQNNTIFQIIPGLGKGGKISDICPIKQVGNKRI